MDLFHLIKTANAEFTYWKNIIESFKEPRNYVRVNSQISNNYKNKNKINNFKRPREEPNSSNSTFLNKTKSDKKPKKEKGTKYACWICGNVHPNQECRLKDATWANHDKSKWWDISEKGKFWKTKGWSTCPPTEEMGERPHENNNNGECLYTFHKLPHIVGIISFSDVSQALNKENKVNILLDTGASDNFISVDCIRELKVDINKIDTKEQKIIKNGFQDLKQSLGTINLQLTIVNERQQIKSYNCIFLIINSSIEVILGSPFIKKWNLIHEFHSLFFSEDKTETILWTKDASSPSVVQSNSGKGGEEKQELNIYNNEINDKDISTSLLNNSKFENQKRNAYEREDISEIDDNYLQAIPAEIISINNYNYNDNYNNNNTNNNNNNNNNEYELPNEFHGPIELQNQLKELVWEFRDQFRNNISKEPARVESFVLEVKKEIWESKENQQSPRRMDRTRETECQRQIDILIKSDILQESRAGFYSHALMVPKSNGKWRFCVDFRKLNLATGKECWPIPNIQLLLNRIGNKKPKYFIVLDLTSGYFQIPISVDSRKFTAFITQWGLFEWKRLPMGLKGAPSFFQRVISTQVLSGLVKVCCELYLDDLIIFAQSIQDLLNNFRRILERFREYNIFINPEKCKLGLEEVSYVGHTINSHGIHFNREKIDGILSMPKKKKHLRQASKSKTAAPYFFVHFGTKKRKI